VARDPRTIAPDLPAFLALLRNVPWFLNLGKSHSRDRNVARIHSWDQWLGPERGFGDWFGRYPAVVRERMEADHTNQRTDLEAVWLQIESLVMECAIPNVPEYDKKQDAWYGPTTCVWQAGYTAALIGCHLLLKRPLPEPIAQEWDWFADGHWPCDYAEEPHGYGDEALIDVPATKLLVY
jgi:hypothetical protein